MLPFKVQVHSRGTYEEYKRQNTIFALIRTVLAIGISLAIVLVLIVLISPEPAEAILSFITGPFTSLRRFGNLWEAMTPLLFTGLASCIMFQAKQFSLIGDGAFYIGPLAATAFALATPVQGLGGIAAGLLVGGVTGAMCGIIPGFLKAKWKANEFVVSMMLNSAITYFGLYVLLNHMRDPNSGFVASYAIPQGMRLARILPGTRIHFGLVIAIFMTVVCYIFLYHTKFGFSIRITGSNAKFARHLGARTFWVIVLVQVIGGFLAGMGGAVEMYGMYERYQWVNSLYIGFDGMTVALLAGNNPALAPLGALFLAYIRVGTEIMARTNSVPNETVYMIQGIIMMLITATGFLAHWRHRLVVTAAKSRQSDQKTEG